MWLLFGSLIGAFLPDVFSVRYQFYDIFQIPQRIGGRCGLCQFIHCDALLLGPANFELRITIYWTSLETLVNSILILFNTSLPRNVGHKMLFLCVGFAVPSTAGSLLLDDVVRNWESIQSPLTKILTGFAFNQEVSADAIDHSLIPIEKTLRTLHFRNCFAQLEQLYIAHFTNHCFRIVTEWVVDVILLQVGMKCFSMRMTLDLLHELANTKVFCLFHNCMWQSRHSGVNVYFLALCEQTGWLSTHKSLRSCLICINVFVCVFVLV